MAPRASVRPSKTGVSSIVSFSATSSVRVNATLTTSPIAAPPDSTSAAARSLLSRFQTSGWAKETEPADRQLIPSRCPPSAPEERRAELADPSGQSTSTWSRISSRCAIVKGEHLRLTVVGGLEPFGGVVEAGVAQLRGQGEDEPVRDGMPARTRVERTPARVAAIVSESDVSVTDRLSPPAEAAARRVLDRAARRLLAARLDAHAVGPASGRDVGTVDDGLDQVALLVEREVVPVGGGDA